MNVHSKSRKLLKTKIFGQALFNLQQEIYFLLKKAAGYPAVFFKS